MRNYGSVSHRFYSVDCGDGWFGLIDEALRDVAAIIERTTPAIQRHLHFVTKIDENCGALRIFLSKPSQEMRDRLNRASNHSAKVCSACGERGHWHAKARWWKVLCGGCAKKLGYSSLSDAA